MYVVEGFRVFTCQYVNPADIALVALDGVARQNSTSGWTIHEISVVFGVESDEYTCRGYCVVMLRIAVLLLDDGEAWGPPYTQT